jgi:hypothetical protein
MGTVTSSAESLGSGGSDKAGSSAHAAPALAHRERHMRTGGLLGVRKRIATPLGVAFPSPDDKRGKNPSPIADESYEDDPERGVFWGPPG